MEVGKRICDTCANFKVSSGGCTECCFENLSEPYYLTQYYFEQRRDGTMNRCKSFNRLPVFIGI